MTRHAPLTSRRSRRVAHRVRIATRWLCLGIAIAWAAVLVLSFFRYDGIEYRTGTLIRPTTTDPHFHHILRTTSALNARGLIAVSWWDYESVGPTEESMVVWKTMVGLRHERVPMGQLRRRAWFGYTEAAHWRFAGLGVEAFTQGGTSGNAVFLPHWLLVAVFGAPSLMHALTYRTRRRHAGMCPRCGYDRIGLETQTPCPECGSRL